ncbi:MAG: hypothetical protein ABI763_05935 [Bacteroidota bacterium]
MILNKNTRELFTDNGDLIKKLHCPFQKEWAELGKTQSSSTRLCNQCGKSVHDSKHFSDAELSQLIRENPETCLKINSHQSNLTLISW